MNPAAIQIQKENQTIPNKLSDLIKGKNTSDFRIEDEVLDDQVIFDKGYYFEACWNNDKVWSDGMDGGCFFFYTNIEISYGEILTCLSDLGSIHDETLTIRLVDENDSQSIDWCKANPISKVLIESLIEGKFLK